jgi:8-hydroxy-5-deazaflavin:NADPH oxidoreductase
MTDGQHDGRTETFRLVLEQLSSLSLPGGTPTTGRQEEPPIDTVGIIGGTGPLGRGLAGRFALAGLAVSLGSRDADRAEEVAGALQAELAPSAARIGSGTNLQVVDADVVIVALPFVGIDAVVPPLADALDGRIVVSVVNPTVFDDVGPHSLEVEEGSAAAAIARRLPGARMTAAFHTVSNRQLQRFDRPMDDDVPVVGDDDEAVATVAALADRIEGCRGVAAGPLRLAAGLELLTPLIIEVNRRNRVHAGIRFSRLRRPGP